MRDSLLRFVDGICAEVRNVSVEGVANLRICAERGIPRNKAWSIGFPQLRRHVAHAVVEQLASRLLAEWILNLSARVTRFAREQTPRSCEPSCHTIVCHGL